MENHLEAECEYELEAIKKRRINSLTGEREFYVQWKDYGPEACSWVPESNLDNAPDMLAAFNQLADAQALKTSSHRQRPAVLIAHEDAPTPVKRRRHGHQWHHQQQHQALQQQHQALQQQVAASESKQRHTSASSVERTPEYRDMRAHQRQQQTARRPIPALPLEKQLEQQQRRRQKEKLHFSSKEIEAVGMLRHDCDPDRDRPTGPIGRVATRKVAPQLEQPTAPQLLHQREQPTLAELLSHPPETTLSAVADAVVACGCLRPDQSAATPGPSSPDLQTLRLLVCGRCPDGAIGNPDSLTAALRHLDRPQLLDAPLDSIRQSKLIHLAATAGPNAPRLLLLLLVAGATPDSQDAHGCTALMLAAKTGNADAVQRLLEFGAWPDTATKDYTALTAAARRGNWSAAAVLLRHGAQFAGLTRLPGFDAAQLRPWTDRLAQLLVGTLLRRLRASDFPQLPPHLVDCQPPYLFAVSRAALRSFTFALPASATPHRAVHLLVTAMAELDGHGGAQLRRVDSSPLARVTINGRSASQIAAATAGGGILAVFPLEDLAQENKLVLAFRGDLPPDRCQLKLLAQVVTFVATGDVPG